MGEQNEHEKNNLVGSNSNVGSRTQCKCNFGVLNFYYG